VKVIHVCMKVCVSLLFISSHMMSPLIDSHYGIFFSLNVLTLTVCSFVVSNICSVLCGFEYCEIA